MNIGELANTISKAIEETGRRDLDVLVHGAYSPAATRNFTAEVVTPDERNSLVTHYGCTPGVPVFLIYIED